MSICALAYQLLQVKTIVYADHFARFSSPTPLPSFTLTHACTTSYLHVTFLSY